jgi:hypothetical protein
MSGVVVVCPEGSSLPFNLMLKGEFLALESALKPLQLNILKTCYVQCDEKEHFLFSTDLQTWKDFSEFFTGEVRVSVERENGGPVASGLSQKFLPLGPRQSPGIELSERGVVSRQYNPPLRQLNRGSFRVGPSVRNFWERPLVCSWGSISVKTDPV